GAFKLLNHLISAGKQRNGEAKRLGGFDIDHELERGGLHHRQIGWRCTLQDPTSIDTSLLIRADPFPREPEQNEYSSLKQPSGRAVTALAKLLCLKKRDVH